MLLESENRRFRDASSAVGGEAATLGEVYDSTVESMRLVENSNAWRVGLERAYDARIDAIFSATGIRLRNPARSIIDHRDAMAGRDLQPFPDLYAEFQRQSEELAASRPEHRAIIAPDRPVAEDAYRLAREADRGFEETWGRSAGGSAAWAARIAGGFVGTASDPINILGLMAGPFGHAERGIKGLTWMAIKAGVANAGVEAAVQPFSQAWRRQAGLPYGLDQAATNVAAAFLFGAGIDAGGRAMVRGVRSAIGRPYLGPPGDPIAALEAAARRAPEGSLIRRAAEGDEAALREIATKAALNADPAVRGALSEMENEGLFRGIKPEAIDDGEHLRQLSTAIGRAIGAGSELPPGDAIAAPKARPAPELGDSAPAKLGTTETLEGKPVAFMAVDPQRVVTDASTFQFKSEGDAAGVTARLKGVKRWDPLSAGKAFVFERANGEMVIADGHQRLGLAKRLADQKPQLHAYVFREVDGWTPADVRAHAAMKNMRELSGSSLDMAKVMRERPDLVDDSLPLSDGKMREAAMLARLGDEAFGAVVAGRLPAPFAALIGEHVPDRTRHAGLLNEIAAADLANAAQARFFLAQLLELPTTTETQITLFGEEAITRTLMAERSRVLDAALRGLKSDKRIFGLLEREAGRIAATGNVLDRQGNAARAANAGELAELIERLATTRGVVATLLNDASIAVSRGLAAAQASRAFVRRIGDLLDQEGINGLLKSGDDAPPAGGRLDDPNGPEAKAQTEALEVDADQGVMFALRGGGDDTSSVVRFRNAGNKGRLEVLNRQLSDLHAKIDNIRAERDDLVDDGRIVELDEQVDMLFEQAGPISDEIAQLEETRAAAILQSGMNDENIKARDQARSLRRQREQLEKSVNDLEIAAANAPSDFALRRNLQIEKGRLSEVAGAEAEARASFEKLTSEIDDIEFALPGSVRAPTRGQGAPSARYAAEAAAIRADIDKAMNTMLPPGWRHQVRDRLVYRGVDVEGMADPYERMIYVSMAALDPLERAFEEAGHALKAAGLIPDPDYAILQAKAREIGARERFDIDGRYAERYGQRWPKDPARVEAALEEEAIMQMVAARARGDTFDRATNGILDKLIKFLRAVRDALGIKGFRTFEDVFEDMTSGAMARRGELPEVDAARRAIAARDAVMLNTGPAGGGAGGTTPPAPVGNIRDLINGALAEGRLSREDADALTARYNELEAHYRDAPPAAEALRQELDAEAARRQRVALLADQARTRIEGFLTNYRDARGQPDPGKAMVALLEHNGLVQMPEGWTSVQGRRAAILGMAMGRLEELLYQHRRTWVTGATREQARLSNIVRELFGEGTGDQGAADLAQAFADEAETLRQRFNAAGGHIGQLENWGMPQHHDRRALLASGFAAWRDHIMPRLDPARMRHPLTGNPMTPAELGDSLQWIYRNITSDGWAEREATAVRFGIGMLANQRAQHRFLVFRDADAWLEYQAEFGGGADPFAAMMNHIRGMSEDIAAMEVLGPNPRSTLTYMQNFVLQQAALRVSDQAAHFPVVSEILGRRMAASGNYLTTRGAEDYARSIVKLTDDMWDIYRGAAGAVVNQRTAETFGTIRNLQIASKLGGAALSAVTDLGFQKMARLFAGLPVLNVWGDLLRGFAATKRDAVRAGLILDTAVNVLHQEARWAGGMQGPAWSRYLADRTIAWSGLAAWTQSGKHGFGLAIQGELAARAGEDFAALPPGLRRLLGRYGLSSADWDAIRASAAGDPDFLTPQMVEADSGLELAERYLEMILQETEYATPTGGLKASALSYGGLRRGVLRDEFWRSGLQFKMFGLSVAMLQGQRIATEMVQNGALRGAGYAAGLLITTTLYGALAIQLKEIAKGKDPRDMADSKFWGHAILQSGGLGIYGDFLFAETNRMGGGLARTLVGPTGDLAASVLALGPGNLAQWAKGEKTNAGREAVQFLGRNTPGGSLWYLRLAYERVLLDNLQRLADPDALAAFRRKVQMQRRDYGNQFFWAPGQSAPQRAPAFGGR